MNISIKNNKKSQLSYEELDEDLSILKALCICQFIIVKIWILDIFVENNKNASWVMRNLTKIYLFWKFYTSASSSLLTIFGYPYINVYPLELHNSVRRILYISIENNKKCRLSYEELDKDLSILKALCICQFITVN